MKNHVVSELFTDYKTTVRRGMAKGGAVRIFDHKRPVMLKPNLVNASPHPVTTPPALCEAVIHFIRQHTDAPIVIAEGCGDANLETTDIFTRLGYDALARRTGVTLLDLNNAPLVRRTDDALRIFPEIWLPEAVFEHVLISLPVLKAHSLCKFTGSMKNMMGIAPPEHYGHRGGAWKKAAFHSQLDDAIVELNRYRKPDFSVMDATIGLAEYHLGGPECDPPANLILAGFDACRLDRAAAKLLSLDWQDIRHLREGR